MMGERQTLQRSFFYEFSLEDHVPADHLLRSSDRFVDLSNIRRRLEPCYSRIGRASIDPELILRMLIIGYSHGIRSERRLCEEVHLNLAYRWFCGLDLNDPVPDHSTFSKNRLGRFRDCDLFRLLFEDVLSRCIREGLVGGEAFGVDASLIKADANREDGIAPADWSPKEHASRATSEYLATLDDAAFGAATPVQPNYLSPVDPAARWSAADRGKAHFIYSTNYLVDLDNAIIVDAEPTAPIRQAERKAARDMIEQTRDRFDLYPERLVGDTATATPRCWPGSSMSKGLNRMSLSSTKPDDGIKRSHAVISRTIIAPMSIIARPAGNSASTAPRCRRRGRHASLPRQQARLRGLRSEASLHAARASPKDHALDPRGCAGPGAGHLKDRRLRHIATPEEEG